MSPETSEPAATAEAEKPPLLQPAVLAALLLPILEFLPAWIIWSSMQNYSRSGQILGALFAVLCALPAIGIALEQAWGIAAARYIAAIGIIAGLLMVMGHGTNVRHIAPIAIFALTLVALNHDRVVRQPKAPAVETGGRDDDAPQWLKENVEALAVAFIMALIIRCFCLEVFMIPSSSMEPTLMGTKRGYQGNVEVVLQGGDRIMVTKYYYTFTPVERFDVMVFKFPLNQVKNFIKRVVGLPEEEVFMSYGNIFYRKDADPDRSWRLARRPLRVQQSIWIDTVEGKEMLLDRHSFQNHWDTQTPRSGDSPAPFDAKDGRLQVREEAGRRGSRFLFDRKSRIDSTGDLKVSADVVLQSSGTVPFYFEIDNEFGTFTLNACAGGESSLSWKGRMDRKVVIGRELAPDRSYRLELMAYDGIAVALINGDVVAEIEYCATYDDIANPRAGHQVAFGSEGALYSLSTLTLGQDVHYQHRSHMLEGPTHSVKIPAGGYLMMGDNVGNSHDSRAWTVNTFWMKDGQVHRCETLDLETNSDKLDELKEKRKLVRTPRYWLKADEYGIERILNDEDVQKYETDAFRFVDQRFLVGKALWVWWPPQRAGRLIR